FEFDINLIFRYPVVNDVRAILSFLPFSQPLVPNSYLRVLTVFINVHHRHNLHRRYHHSTVAASSSSASTTDTIFNSGKGQEIHR
ncbi:hypothetical protein VIGAN_06070200, partial [Vigna angularis var. angularis]